MKTTGNRLSPKPITAPKPGTVKVVKALNDYTAQNESELSFNEGDILYIVDQSHPQWWKARRGSKCGLIPFDGKLNEIINPLHEAARRGNLTFLKECLSNKVSYTALDSMGNTPLYWAAHSGHTDCVIHLLGVPNAPLNAQNHFGDTALHGAAAKNHLDVVQILMEAGCDSNILNNNKETPEQLTGSKGIKNALQKCYTPVKGMKCTRIPSEEYEDDSD